METPTALFCAAHTFAITRSWPKIFDALRDRGWDVAVAAPEERGADVIRSMGYRFVPTPFTRRLATPLQDVAALRSLRSTVRELRPALIHAFHAKPIVISAAALIRRPDVRLVCTVAGLGRLTESRNRVLRQLLWAAHYRANRMVFQNPSDAQMMRRMGGSLAERSIVIEGAGVDLERWKPAGHAPREQVRALMAARLIVEKGVLDYIEAGRILRDAGVPVRLLLAGEPDPSHPGSVPIETLERAHDEGVIEHLGHVEMETLMPDIDVAVLPSYYGEGVPRFLLEASACEIPSVTVDAPGCKDAVIDGETGFIVPPKDPKALASAISRLATDAPLRRTLGAAARAFVSKSYDARQVVAAYLACYASVGVEIDR